MRGVGLVGLRNLVTGQEFRQNLGVEPIGLLDRLGDDPELVGIGQYDPLGQGFDQVDQPVITGGGLTTPSMTPSRERDESGRVPAVGDD